MFSLSPRRPPPDATKEDRLRYIRQLAISSALLSIPIWTLLFAFTQSGGAILLFAVVAAITVLNIVSLSWRISRAKGQ